MLKLNSDKTHFLMIISPQKRQAQQHPVEMMFGDEMIGESSSERCLGVQISNSLCGWGQQIGQGSKCIISKCGKIMNDLKKTSEYFSFKRRLNIGKSLVMSKMMYGADLWGPAATQHQMELLQSAQNKLIKWICQSRGPTTSDQERNSCNLLTVYQMVVFRVLCLGLTVIQTGKPVNLHNSLTGNNETDAPLRQSQRNVFVRPSDQHYQQKS